MNNQNTPSDLEILLKKVETMPRGQILNTIHNFKEKLKTYERMPDACSYRIYFYQNAISCLKLELNKKSNPEYRYRNYRKR